MKEKIILNPISKVIKESISNASKKINIAVPFISPFAQKIIKQEVILSTVDKRLITRFDENNINTFDLPTLEYLIDCGFQICYNNRIHLKLYITDSKTFVTSSNLTKGGFENNIELTVDVESNNFANCQQIFDDLWEQSKNNLITKAILKKNYDKYEVLLKRQKHKTEKIPEVGEIFRLGTLDVRKLIDEVFNSNEDYSNHIKLSGVANKSRNQIRDRLKSKGFNAICFYAPEGHSRRYKNLFYDFSYGIESKLAGTGLRESQFRAVFEHSDFKKVISYVYPESIGLEPWNFEDEKSRLNFCNGLFDFRIPQYAEALPIRLASYFYPQYFVSIFRLSHMQKVCDELGINTEAKTKGERLYAYSTFLSNIMRDIPYDSYIKSVMIYQILYSIELFRRIEVGEDYDEILNSYKKQWMKYYIEKGKVILKRIKAI
ncbi:hypothetical protein D1816_23785 [Aquimarina sp. AD10]|uniref:phospholipase D family protein n=1 Tax=Aquimarina sp. AD10 TaxID=1714849 RepID=UPI000E5220E1|nr:phospholipase D family protein [Aquimarina sp. AD10]AXT63239.1 hypothetical protein D1816_23785 [Aquimarina sp. AD10]RKN00748.1 hypothetical protein D7033_07910 [Aquimarina sp. AD10]